MNSAFISRRFAYLGLMLLIVATTVFSWVPPSHASQSSGQHEPDVFELSIEELMQIKVTSVAKKRQRLSEAAAAVYVITAEDIHRSGMRSIPELLRLVPGLEVAQVTANKWAISARGFNGTFSNKLLVLIDGRSVYTPLFGGVFWDVQDTLLEDIERIEVIRGPGGTLWGANAVNGVINIITKRASDTQGLYATAGAGNIERGFTSLRYGGKLGEHAAYRVYGKYFNRNNFRLPDGEAAHDEWDQGRGGFRIDWDLKPDHTLTIQGDGYAGSSDQTDRTVLLTPPFESSTPDTDKVGGGNVLLRWKHRISSSSDFALQLYYDRTQRNSDLFGVHRDTYDIDVQHRFKLLDRHDLMWGADYRLTADGTDPTPTVEFTPRDRDIQIISGFIQDDISLIPDRLRLILGTKISYNTYTKMEYQPNGRLLWKPAPKHTLWAAISRAVRLPTRADRDLRINVAALPGPTLVSIFGNPDFKAEELLAYELGYRTTPFPHVSLDVAGFYNVYQRLTTAEMLSPRFEADPPPPHTLIPLQLDNMMNGNSYGIEVATGWQVTPSWKLSANYTWLRLRLTPDASSNDTGAGSTAGDNPKHQFRVRSTYRLPYDLEFNTGIYYVSQLTNQDVPSYTRVDARIAWNPFPGLEAAVVGQNLFEKQHPEFRPVGATAIFESSDVPRSVYGQITWRF